MIRNPLRKRIFRIVKRHGKFLNIGNLLLNYRDIVYGLIVFLFGFIVVKEIINIVNNVKKAKEEELREKALSRLREEEKERLRRDLEEDGEK